MNPGCHSGQQLVLIVLWVDDLEGLHGPGAFRETEDAFVEYGDQQGLVVQIGDRTDAFPECVAIVTEGAVGRVECVDAASVGSDPENALPVLKQTSYGLFGESPTDLRLWHRNALIRLDEGSPDIQKPATYCSGPEVAPVVQIQPREGIGRQGVGIAGDMGQR